LKSNTRSELALCAGLFVVAAIVRVLFLAATVDRQLPFSLFYYGDSRIYREFALALMRGELFDQGIPLHPPAFAYVLSWLIGRLGERPVAIRAALAVVGATVVPMTYLLGRLIWGRAVGLTAALLATFSFGLCVVSVSANAETIYFPLLVLQALLVVVLGDVAAGGRAGAAAIVAIASGVVLGLGALTRAEHFGFALLVPVALTIGWPDLAWRRIAPYAAAIAAIGMLVTTPWAIRNHRALTRFNAANAGKIQPLPTWVGVSASGPLVFALANNPRADGTFRADAFVSSMGQGRIDLTDPAQADIYLHGYRRGWEFLVGDPKAAAALLVRKLDRAADAHALGFGLSNWPGGLVGTRSPVDVFVPSRRVFRPVFWVLLVAGIWVSRPRLRRAGILWLAGLQVLAVTLASFGYARFFLQFVPFVFLFQAAAMVALTARLRTVASRRAVVLLGVILAALLTVELAVATARPRNFRASGSVNPETGKIAQDAAVELTPADGE
jgi:4-amino-4-deoxy-L-arabinose transferase-like glycosyltransferase